MTKAELLQFIKNTRKEFINTPNYSIYVDRLQKFLTFLYRKIKENVKKDGNLKTK